MVLPSGISPLAKGRRENTMPDSPLPDQESSSSEEPEIFEPSGADRDPEAEAQMRQGREDLHPDNALYDPYFENPEDALRWSPDQTPHSNTEEG